MFELGDAGPCVIDVGVGHGRVLALDIHAPDLAGIGGVDDLDHRQAGLGRQRRLPQVLIFLMDLGTLHVGIVGIEHRDQARLRGALHVVLAAKRMQTGAGPPNLAAHQRERDQATGIVGTVHMLGDTHPPEDHGALGPAEVARDLADGDGVDAANIGHGFRAVAR